MVQSVLRALSAWCLFFAASGLQASSAFTCTEIPEGTPTGINNNGQVVGTAGNESFLRNPDGSIVPISYPDAVATHASAINNSGEIAGWYSTSDGAAHGFIRNASGDYEDFDVPANEPGGSVSELSVGGINDKGQVTLFYHQYSPVYWNTLVIRNRDGSFKTVFSAGFHASAPQGVGAINNAGAFVEQHAEFDGYLRFADGKSLTLTVPGQPSGKNSLTVGLNNNGDTAGFSTTGFIRSADGHFQSVVCPQAVSGETSVNALNDAKEAVGVLRTREKQIGIIARPVTAGPGLKLSNDNWTFSAHPPGETSGLGRVYLTSTGPADLHLTDLYLGPSDGGRGGYTSFKLTGQTCIGTGTPPPVETMPQGDWCSVDFRFTPVAGGWQEGSIYIIDDSPASPHIIRAGGVGIGSNLELSKFDWFFGQVPVGEPHPGVIYIYNNGPQAATMRSPSIVGVNSGDYAVIGNTCTPTLGGYKTCAVSFTFKPTAPGQRGASLQIPTDSSRGTISILLSGFGY